MARLAVAVAYTLALTAIAVPHVTEVSPAQAPLGHETAIEVTVAGATPDTRVSLAPGGPFLSGSIDLPRAKRVFAVPNSDQLLAFTEHDVVLLNGDADPPAILSRAVIDASIQTVTAYGGAAVMADDRNALYAVSIVDSTQVQLTPLTVLDQPVKDLALGEGVAYALLADGAVMRADLRSAPGEWVALGLLAEPAERIAYDGQHCFFYGPATDLSITECTPGTLNEVSRFRSSGQIHDLQMVNGVATLADGTAGMTLLDVNDIAQPRLIGSFNKLGDARHVAVDGDRVIASNARGELTLLNVSRATLPLLVSKLRVARAPGSIALRADHVWTTAADMLARLDFSAEPAALLSDEGVSQGGSRRAFIRNTTLYVADWFSGLHLYDVSSPSAIRHLGNYHSPGSSKGVVVRDRYAFVGDDDHGVQIVDVSNPARPVAVKNVPTTGLAYTMKLVDDRLYVADHRGGIHIVDVSDIPNAHILGSFDTPGKAWAIDVRDQVAFVADDSSGLLVFDTSDPKHIRQIGQFAPGGQAEDVRLRGRYAFITFFDQGLYVVDTLDPRAPREVSHVAIPGNARGIDFQGDYGYVAAWEAGLQVVDLRDVRHPRLVSYFDTDGSAWGVNVSGDSAYVLDWWGGVKRVDIRDPLRPALATQYQANGDITDLALNGCCAATVGASGSVQLYDVTNGLNPIWINGIDLDGDATSIAWSGATGYVAASTGIAVVDLRDPYTARFQKTIPMPWRPVVVRAASNKIVAMSASGTTALVDPSTGEIRTVSSGVSDLWIADNTIYVARGALGITGYSLAGVSVTTKTTWQKPGTSARLLRVDEKTALAVDGERTLRVLARNENTFTEIAQLECDAAVRDLQLVDQTAYATTAANELLVIALSDPRHPVVTHRYASATDLTRLAVRNGFVFLAGERKLSSVKLLPTIAFSRRDATTFSATLPSTLPQGAYDLAVSVGGRALPGLHNAVRVTIKTGKKPGISPERFQELLNQQRGTTPAR